MMPSIKGQTALVTGAGRGICLAFTKKLLESGYNVVIADLAMESEAETLVTQHGDGQGRAVFIKVWYSRSVSIA